MCSFRCKKKCDNCSNTSYHYIFSYHSDSVEINNHVVELRMLFSDFSHCKFHLVEIQRNAIFTLLGGFNVITILIT